MRASRLSSTLVVGGWLAAVVTGALWLHRVQASASAAANDVIARSAQQQRSQAWSDHLEADLQRLLRSSENALDEAGSERAMVLALSIVLAPWLSALIVGVVVAMIGAVLLANARSHLKPENLAPKHTMDALKRDKEFVGQLGR